MSCLRFGCGFGLLVFGLLALTSLVDIAWHSPSARHWAPLAATCVALVVWYRLRLREGD